MITEGYKLSFNEIKEFKELKNSELYGNYLKSIFDSPAFTTIINEHVKNINIIEDIKRLKKENAISNTADEKTIENTFKSTLSRMVCNILADSIILKELEDCKVSEIKNNFSKETNIVYLLGEADEKFYKKAKNLVEEGKVDSNSIMFKGLVTYMKKHNKSFDMDLENDLIEKSEDYIEQDELNHEEKDFSKVEL